MTIRGKDVLRKTVSKYISDTKKLLRYFGINHTRLANYKEKANPLKRKPKLRPKIEYCALE